MLPAVWGQDSTPGLPGSVCTLAPGWAGARGLGHYHLGGPPFCSGKGAPDLWLLRLCLRLLPWGPGS